MSNLGVEITVTGLSKRFEKGGQTIEVLRDVNLKVKSGERLAIVGPSGCGKSTLLHLLGTLESPTEGVVKFDDREVVRVENGKSSHNKASLNKIRNSEIGFVFQFHHLLLEHTAIGNVAMPLLIRGTNEDEANTAASEMLALVGLSHRMNHRPGELSGGEQQRVAIARAMVTRPGLILADEPTGNLDPKTANDVFEMFIKLNQEFGTTLIVVTHSIELSNRFPRSLTVVDGTLEES